MAEADAFEAALGALDRKERTAHELALWLKGRGFAMDEIEAALRRLFETEVLDDERFARRYAEDKRELSGWGPDRIREALLGRGVHISRDDRQPRAYRFMVGDNSEIGIL